MQSLSGTATPEPAVPREELRNETILKSLFVTGSVQGQDGGYRGRQGESGRCRGLWGEAEGCREGRKRGKHLFMAANP